MIPFFGYPMELPLGDVINDAGADDAEQVILLSQVASTQPWVRLLIVVLIWQLQRNQKEL